MRVRLQGVELGIRFKLRTSLITIQGLGSRLLIDIVALSKYAYSKNIDTYV